MQIKNDQQNYGLIAIILHWLIAIVTFGLFGLGLWMTGLGYYDDWYMKAPKLHEGIGVLLFIFLLIRMQWGWVNSSPEFLSNHKQWERTGASLAQGLLNGLFLVISISGYLIVTAKGEPLNMFNLFNIPASLSGISNQEDLAGEIHLFGAWGLITLAGIHALASLKHHFIDKDSTLKRILGL